MIRTQIQLTEPQAKKLQKLAQTEGLSVAELIRRSVDYYIQDPDGPDHQRLVTRAKEAAGKYQAVAKDLAKNHDRYLVEDYQK
jgi:hypothetical protein